MLQFIGAIFSNNWLDSQVKRIIYIKHSSWIEEEAASSFSAGIWSCPVSVHTALHTWEIPHWAWSAGYWSLVFGFPTQPWVFASREACFSVFWQQRWSPKRNAGPWLLEEHLSWAGAAYLTVRSEATDCIHGCVWGVSHKPPFGYLTLWAGLFSLLVQGISKNGQIPCLSSSADVTVSACCLSQMCMCIFLKDQWKNSLRRLLTDFDTPTSLNWDVSKKYVCLNTL